jgi:hypothetical protein
VEKDREYKNYFGLKKMGVCHWENREVGGKIKMIFTAGTQEVAVRY